MATLALIEIAKKDGCETASDMASWIKGYEMGSHDTQMRALNIINNIHNEEYEEPFPLFAEESIRLNDEAYDKASSNSGELI